jgi:thioredoxin reductase
LNTEIFDVAVVGGSYAGLSAALPLARARRRVAMVDAGLRRNRFALASHGFIGHDGDAPGAIVAKGREQLLAYANVQWFDTTALAVHGENDAFVLTLPDGGLLRARRLVLAIGVHDELPPIEGLQERWGRSVFHCPYCHGYELQQGRIGVIASGEVSLHHALMLPDWGEVTLFTHETFVPDAQQRAQLAKRGVTVETPRVLRVVDKATVQLADGRDFALDGLFVLARMQMASPLAQQLGCAFDEGPAGPYIRTDAMKETSVPGVFACGDAARAAGSVALAVGDGAMAGVAAHRSLITAALAA